MNLKDTITTEKIEQAARDAYRAQYGNDFNWSDLTAEAKSDWRTKMTSELRKKARSARARTNRKMKDEALRSLGLVKVRGQLGGTYWE